jgi:hypothetical protein
MERNLAAGGFLKLLKELRKIILQDAVSLKKKFPNNPLFNHHLFRSNMFLLFEKDLNHHMDTSTPPTDIQLRTSMPLMVEKFDQIQHSLGVLKNEISNISQKIETSRIPRMNISLDWSGASDSNNQNISSLSTPNIPFISNSSESLVSEVPQYEIKSTTVPQLWKEYTVGLDQNPSISSLDDQFGKKWRKSEKSRKLYERRMKVIKLLKGLIEANNEISVENVVNIVEEKRVLKNKSLHYMSQNIEEFQ